mmetsp:Transcript_17131/g.22504  ORF Transcript_17131/g.22504 Transcript_17131/m.22504 type:complete len:261 (-) Transcript_17131:75-857(-)|eukprot:CAMPEP_0195269132 /NCGR_PEP_ID=MMETSP0706-20130129/13578_1 /TAXON_ID=33640 /ORGANISM="Asterionellopsis glacialis, Strain CCMP134" /LENGTH=260 /DNA_ID=CAMNT_0040324165 /DNA_START=174 /DNA_END=956 /DNA_ORIENTATION=-
MRTSKSITTTSVPLAARDGGLRKFQLVPDSTTTTSSSNNQDFSNHPCTFTWDSELDKMMHEDLAKPRGSLADLSFEILMLTKSSFGCAFDDDDDDNSNNDNNHRDPHDEHNQKDHHGCTKNESSTLLDSHKHKDAKKSTIPSTSTIECQFEDTSPPTPTKITSIAPLRQDGTTKTFTDYRTSSAGASSSSTSTTSSDLFQNPQRRRNSTGLIVPQSTATPTRASLEDGSRSCHTRASIRKTTRSNIFAYSRKQMPSNTDV